MNVNISLLTREGAQTCRSIPIKSVAHHKVIVVSYLKQSKTLNSIKY